MMIPSYRPADVVVGQAEFAWIPAKSARE